jgi:hypothetical protein
VSVGAEGATTPGAVVEESCPRSGAAIASAAAVRTALATRAGRLVTRP